MAHEITLVSTDLDYSLTDRSPIHRRPVGLAKLGPGSHLTTPFQIYSPHRVEVGKDVWFSGGAILRVSDLDSLGFEMETELTIGDECFFEEDLTIECDSQVAIGHGVVAAKRVYIGGYVGCDRDVGPDEPGPRPPACGQITIGDQTFLGTGCAILSGVDIGERSIISAGAVVTRNVPARSVVFGNPARVVRSWDDDAGAWRIGG